MTLRFGPPNLSPAAWVRMLAAGAVLLAIGACETSPKTSDSTDSTGRREAGPGGTAFVYPPDPPVVHLATLRGLLRRFAGHEVILYAWRSGDGRAGERLESLAAFHERHREAGVKAVALYVGPAGDWRGNVVPTLQRSKANYPCAVLTAQHEAAVGAWLSRGRTASVDGLYLVDATGEPAAHWPADASFDEIGAKLAQLGKGGHSAPAAVGEASVVLVETKTGRTLATATASVGSLSAMTTIAQQLASQINAVGDSSGRSAVTAVLPLHERTVVAREQRSGMYTAEGVAEHLRALGWTRVVPVRSSAEQLRKWGIDVLAVEFDPRSLPSDCAWDRVIVGWVRVGGSDKGR